MTLAELITLIVAILGVLHGPLSAQLIKMLTSKSKTK